MSCFIFKVELQSCQPQLRFNFSSFKYLSLSLSGVIGSFFLPSSRSSDTFGGMPSYTRKVNVQGKSASELYETVSKDIDRFLEKAMVGKVTVDRDPGKKEFHIKNPMFSATLSCTENHMAVDGQLSFMALPFKSKLDEGITKWLAKAFSDSKVT